MERRTSRSRGIGTSPSRGTLPPPPENRCNPSESGVRTECVTLFAKLPVLSKLPGMSASSIKTLPVSVQASGLAIDSSKQRERTFRSDGPSQRELILLWLLSLICFLVVLTHFRSYTAEILKIGDNEQYISAAQAIQHWDFRSTQARQSWGVSYLIAFLSEIGIPGGL